MSTALLIQQRHTNLQQMSSERQDNDYRDAVDLIKVTANSMGTDGQLFNDFTRLLCSSYQGAVHIKLIE